MTTDTLNTPQQARRLAIERIIAPYPDISDEKLQDVLHYFRRECSALDRATIASNNAVAHQYRQLCEDHHIDRLKPAETAIAIVAGLVLMAGFVALFLLF